ncbi:MAG: hypothetical protein F6K54_00635 [Okeania sp. SIO3B5]|uniref:hypothetical protein n=1 Tax=Okeania sp. SIO3B5 TaxID=2607811 RepID=UPI0013FEAD8D|nr:hypothetical protein [Okeania sp. SIO3B5]NEO51734.1 hypothetical protein [Okeania sp. SIO3B5]
MKIPFLIATLPRGSWLNNPGNCRSAYCQLNRRDHLYSLIGFRVVSDGGRTLSNQDNSTLNTQYKQKLIADEKTNYSTIVDTKNNI